MMKLTGEAAMQAKMRELFASANKDLKFWKAKNPGRWVIIVDGEMLGERIHESDAFQEALDKSGIGGKISYKYSETKQEWTFRYTARRGE